VSLVRSLIPHQFVRGVKQVDFLASQAEQDAKLPRPLFALTVPDPLPTGIIVPAEGLALPTFALKGIDDRCGVAIAEAGAIFEVSGEIFDHLDISRLSATLALTVEDVSGAGGNVDWFFAADTMDDMGVVLETTVVKRQVTSNLRVMVASFVEMLDAAGLLVVGTTKYGFRVFGWHNAGGNRALNVTSCEVTFAEQDRLAA